MTVRLPRALGIDIGGANLKVADARGPAVTVPFALWQQPAALSGKLRTILRRFPHDLLAVTMTGELCDCFPNKSDGVHAILNSVRHAARKAPVQIWSTHGCFVSIEEARADPWRVASANWHALATFAGRFAPQGAALLIDIGSTTTDIIPLWQGKPVPRGLTDPQRLASGELVYTGVRRTPVCAVLGLGMTEDALGTGVAAELFATMLDVYLILGAIPEEPANSDTADGRPATRSAAHARLARMACADGEHFSANQAIRLARLARRRQVECIVRSIARVCKTLPAPPKRVLLSGSGEFLARLALARLRNQIPARIGGLSRKLSPSVSSAACAYALAVLAEECLSINLPPFS